MERLDGIQRRSIRHVSINTGFKCNQACWHCHLDAGPDRHEIMEMATVERLEQFIRNIKPKSVDITGGAPELMPGLEALVEAIRPLVDEFSIRTNLVLLNLAEFCHLKKLFSRQKIKLIGSLPCYTPENVNRQRGGSVFARSISALKELNSMGYGRNNSLELDLVYNPGGPVLSPDQSTLENKYRKILKEVHGIDFNGLLAINNVPVGRFKKYLEDSGSYNDYIRLLSDNFNYKTITKLMCLDQVTIDWKGRIFDCDFNLALDLPGGGFSDIEDNDPKGHIGRQIYIGPHCLACTAGSGSSCQGSLELSNSKRGPDE